jgi:toxin ParE1/3/4
VTEVFRSSRAREDLRACALYIARDSPDAALRFLDAAEAAFARLLERPYAGIAVALPSPRLAGLRRWSVPGFPSHLIFYLPTDEGIEIVRVLHGARDTIAALLEE